MADLDHFKRINDTHGHEAGDRALALFAQQLRAHLRSQNLLARYGGEEFVVVLPDVDTDGAVSIAETIRTGILDLGIRHDAGASGRLTVSIGVTTSYPEHDDDMQGALKLADDALYRAKEGGRNRIVVHPAASGGLAARRA